MICCIFGDSRYFGNRVAVKRIKKAFRHQAKFNMTVALFASVATGYMILTEARLNEQNKKLCKRRNEFRELKRTKGE